MATIRSNGPQGREVKSFVFPRGSDCVAIQTQPLGRVLLSDHSTQRSQTRRGVFSSGKDRQMINF